jgi:hypothetical protein
MELGASRDDLSQSLQIIHKKIDADRLDDIDYIRNIRRSIKRSHNKNADIVVIELIPKSPIKEKWILKSWLHFQREFTDLLMEPKNNIGLEDDEIMDMKRRLKAKEIYKRG